jgi:hypothetical protein
MAAYRAANPNDIREASESHPYGKGYGAADTCPNCGFVIISKQQQADEAMVDDMWRQMQFGFPDVR